MYHRVKDLEIHKRHTELVARWKPCRRLLGFRGAPKESSCYGLQSVQGGQKVGLLRSETMPKQFPNNSKKTSKKSRKRLSQPPKYPNLRCQSGQKCRFLGLVSTYNLYFWLVGTETKKLKSFPLIARDIQKKPQKKPRVFPKKIWKGKYANPPTHTPTNPPTHQSNKESGESVLEV